jgi:acetyl esterase/lipase
MRICFLLVTLQLVLAAGEFKLTDGLVWSKPNGQELAADLYLPDGPGPFPVAVYLHGGGWSSGDRKQLRRQAAHMAQKGVAGFAIEYRLAPANKYPAAFEDAEAAVKWVRDNAGKYHFDARRVAAVGSSAGGHLACLLGTSGKGEASVSAVVAFNPVLDLTDTTRSEAGNIKFLGGVCAEHPAACKEASPVLQVHPNMPPFLILHGTTDENVPFAQAVHMVAALKGAGDPVDFFQAEGGKHTFWSTDKWYAPTEQAMENFLLKVFQQ